MYRMGGVVHGIKIYQIDLKRVSFENEDEKERKNK